MDDDDSADERDLDGGFMEIPSACVHKVLQKLQTNAKKAETAVEETSLATNASISSFSNKFRGQSKLFFSANIKDKHDIESFDGLESAELFRGLSMEDFAVVLQNVQAELKAKQQEQQEKLQEQLEKLREEVEEEIHNVFKEQSYAFTKHLHWFQKHYNRKVEQARIARKAEAREKILLDRAVIERQKEELEKQHAKDKEEMERRFEQTIKWYNERHACISRITELTKLNFISMEEQAKHIVNDCNLSKSELMRWKKEAKFEAEKAERCFQEIQDVKADMQKVVNEHKKERRLWEGEILKLTNVIERMSNEIDEYRLQLISKTRETERLSTVASTCTSELEATKERIDILNQAVQNLQKELSSSEELLKLSMKELKTKHQKEKELEMQLEDAAAAREAHDIETHRLKLREKQLVRQLDAGLRYTEYQGQQSSATLKRIKELESEGKRWKRQMKVIDELKLTLLLVLRAVLKARVRRHGVDGIAGVDKMNVVKTTETLPNVLHPDFLQNTEDNAGEESFDVHEAPATEKLTGTYANPMVDLDTTQPGPVVLSTTSECTSGDESTWALLSNNEYTSNGSELHKLLREIKFASRSRSSESYSPKSKSFGSRLARAAAQEGSTMFLLRRYLLVHYPSEILSEVRTGALRRETLEFFINLVFYLEEEIESPNEKKGVIHRAAERSFAPLNEDLPTLHPIGELDDSTKQERTRLQSATIPVGEEGGESCQSDLENVGLPPGSRCDLDGEKMDCKPQGKSLSDTILPPPEVALWKQIVKDAKKKSKTLCNDDVTHKFTTFGRSRPHTASPSTRYGSDSSQTMIDRPSTTQGSRRYDSHPNKIPTPLPGRSVDQENVSDLLRKVEEDKSESDRLIANLLLEVREKDLQAREMALKAQELQMSMQTGQIREGRPAEEITGSQVQTSLIHSSQPRSGNQLNGQDNQSAESSDSEQNNMTGQSMSSGKFEATTTLDLLNNRVVPFRERPDPLRSKRDVLRPTSQRSSNAPKARWGSFPHRSTGMRKGTRPETASGTRDRRRERASAPAQSDRQYFMAVQAETIKETSGALPLLSADGKHQQNGAAEISLAAFSTQDALRPGTTPGRVRLRRNQERCPQMEDEVAVQASAGHGSDSCGTTIPQIGIGLRR